MGFWDYRGAANIDLTSVEKNEVWRIELLDRTHGEIFQLLPSCSSSVTAALREPIEWTR